MIGKLAVVDPDEPAGRERGFDGDRIELAIDAEALLQRDCRERVDELGVTLCDRATPRLDG